MAFQLTIESGDEYGKSIEFTNSACRIGSGPEMSFTVNGTPEHAISVVDSKHSVFVVNHQVETLLVNGESVLLGQRLAIQPGQTIQLGTTVLRLSKLANTSVVLASPIKPLPMPDRLSEPRVSVAQRTDSVLIPAKTETLATRYSKRNLSQLDAERPNINRGRQAVVVIVGVTFMFIGSVSFGAKTTNDQASIQFAIVMHRLQTRLIPGDHEMKRTIFLLRRGRVEELWGNEEGAINDYMKLRAQKVENDWLRQSIDVFVNNRLKNLGHSP